MEAMGSVGAGKNPVGSDKSGAVLETFSVKASEAGVEFYSPELLQSSIWTEVLKSRNDLEPDVEKSVVLYNKLVGVDWLIVEPSGIESGVEDKLLIKTVRTKFKQMGDDVQDEDNIKGKLFKVAVSENSAKQVQAESEGDSPEEARKQVKTGTFSEIRVDQEDKIEKILGPPHESDLDHPDQKSQTHSTEGEMEVGGFKGKVGNEMVVCNGGVGGLGGKVGKEIVVYNGGVGGLERNVGKEIVVYNGELGSLERKVGKEIVVCNGELGGLEERVGKDGGLEGKVGNDRGLERKGEKEIVVCNGELGGLEGKVGKDIVVYKGEVGSVEGKLGEEIMVCNGELGGLEGKLGKDIVVYKGEEGGVEGKLGEEIVLCTKDKSLKRKFSGSFASENEFQKENVGLEVSMERIIVRGLMARPNCPWKQEKGAFNPNPAGSVQGTKGRKQYLMGQEKSESFSMAMNADTENLRGKYIKKKSPSTGKVAYHGIYEMVVRHEVDSLEHDEDHEDFHVGRRSHSFPPFGPSGSSGKGDGHHGIVTRSKVRDTLRLFQAVCRKPSQEEESKSMEGRNCSRSVNLQAERILKDKGNFFNRGKPILGPVPGVEVGDEFHYMAELATIGLHRHFQDGIDYIKQGGKVLATSIVASEGYANDLDNSDVLIYSGSGGKVTGGEKQPGDQKLERGNLALKNSMDAKSPVRVIRGFRETKASDPVDTRGKIVMTYVYDGLYLVEKYWQEVGMHSKRVFKFHLGRIPGQPKLAWNEADKSKKFKIQKVLRVNDVSQGKESIPICAVNTIDDEKPSSFKYITCMTYPSWYSRIPPKGCACIGRCSDSEKCSCAVKNGGEIPYNYDGAIVEAKPLVYECGPSCKCPPSCHNRVSQHGIKLRLEIFKTESRGWGVRSLNSIPSGSFICELLGEILEDKEAEQRTDNDEYLFDIGQNYNDHTLWDGLSNFMPDSQSSSCEIVEDGGFTIDALQYGNVGRFINHSCSPNLYAQNVLYDHDDKRMPHIMFFATENIPPLQELSYHYNYMIDQVRDSDGNIKKKSCYCGSPECTGRMY